MKFTGEEFFNLLNKKNELKIILHFKDHMEIA